MKENVSPEEVNRLRLLRSRIFKENNGKIQLRSLLNKVDTVNEDARELFDCVALAVSQFMVRYYNSGSDLRMFYSLNNPAFWLTRHKTLYLASGIKEKNFADLVKRLETWEAKVKNHIISKLPLNKRTSQERELEDILFPIFKQEQGLSNDMIYLYIAHIIKDFLLGTAVLDIPNDTLIPINDPVNRIAERIKKRFNRKKRYK